MPGLRGIRTRRKQPHPPSTLTPLLGACSPSSKGPGQAAAEGPASQRTKEQETLGGASRELGQSQTEISFCSQGVTDFREAT